MASAARPYGLRPVNMLGSQVMTHGMRLMRIASAYATSIFYGDVVSLADTGYIAKSTVTADASTVLTDMPVGVFLGVEYETSTQGLLHRQMWTASTATVANKNIWAYVCDDPDALFEAQCAGTLTQTAIGLNCALVQNAGNSATGNSAVALNATPAVTAALPVRIIDFVDKPGSAVGDAYTDVIVKLNHHRYRHTTGL
jgi:hypothetical protein